MTESALATRFTRHVRFAWWQVVAHLASLAPLAVLVWDAQHHGLTANPYQAAEDRMGVTALVFLVLSLACTPLGTALGVKQAVKLRRALGLYGFLYAAVHIFIFVVLDYGGDLGTIVGMIGEKPYVLVGTTAILLLIPLALTSTRGWMRRLCKTWRRLHYLVYLIVPLVVAHYYWVVKVDERVPLQYAAVVALLLFVRIPAVRRFAVNLRYRLASRLSSRQHAGRYGKGQGAYEQNR